MHNHKKLWMLVGAAGLLMGCSNSDCNTNNCAVDYGISPEYSVTRLALSGICSINVKNESTGEIKTVDMETDYVPNVTHCENGGAPFEALRSQAVLARSVAYYKLRNNVNASIRDSTNDQVYSCVKRAPSEAQFKKMLAASMDTNGIVLRRSNVTVCAFFRAGSKEEYLNDECKFVGGEGTTGWVSHQGKVTYNWGNSGSDVIKSSSGSNVPANSGCYSQNGAMCLARKGWVWQNIIKFFYGMDIGIERAEDLTCITHPKCETQLNGGETIIDDTNECFSRKVSDNYFTLGTPLGSSAEKVGYGDSLQFAYTWDKDAAAVGTWKVNVKKAGKYLISAYIDSKAGSLSQNAPYQIRANGVEKTVNVDISKGNGWVEIGKFDFAAGEDQWVKLTDATGEAYTDKKGKRVIFDALKFEWANDCTDECTESGASECHGSGLRTCGDWNGDKCFEWSEDKACNSPEICKSGECINPESECTNECTEGQTECVENGAGFRKCEHSSATSCLKWSDVTYCGAGTICENAACVANTDVGCQSECQDGQKKCTSDGVVTCGQFDNDECLEWSDAKKCGNDKICQAGECIEDLSGVMPKTCLTAVNGKETIIDELDACFVQSESSLWKQLDDYGHEDHLFYADVLDEEQNRGAVGTWYLNVTKSGEYEIKMYVETAINSVVDKLHYSVLASGVIYPVDVNTQSDGNWVSLGTYSLKAGETQYIQLTNISDAASDGGKRVVYDAAKIIPAGYQDDDVNDVGSMNPKIILSGGDCSMNGMPSDHSWLLWMMMAGFLGIGYSRRRRINA